MPSLTFSGLAAILGSFSIWTSMIFFSSSSTSWLTSLLSRKRGFRAAICMATSLPISVTSISPVTSRFTSTPILPPAWI